MATLGPLDEFLTARIVALMDPYERVGLRGSSRAFRAACGDALHRMTPRKMWKYAAIRGLDVVMSRACDAGARDLMRYAGSRASFEECRAAWSKSFAVWTSASPALIGDDEELAKIRAIVHRDYAKTRRCLESETCLEDARIVVAIGKYADEGIIREAVFEGETYRGWQAQIITGAMIAHRDDLARDLVQYAIENWDGDEIFEYLSACALYAENIEIFKLINDESSEKMENSKVDEAARSGNVEVFKYARKQYESWRDDIDKVLERAIESGSIEMLDEVREYDELKSLRHQQRSGGSNVMDLDINFNFGQGAKTMKVLAQAAARKGNREMCDYVLAWTRATGDFDWIARAMLNEAITRDHYWVVDMVLAHMRAVQGPGYARPRAAIRAPCCAIMLRE